MQTDSNTHLSTFTLTLLHHITVLHTDTSTDTHPCSDGSDFQCVVFPLYDYTISFKSPQIKGNASYLLVSTNVASVTQVMVKGW